jgi:hypothetical protein
MDMTEDPIHSTGDITLMIDGITLTIEGGISMMEGIILMLEDITSMMDHITMMIEGITSMIEDKCTLKLWIEEGFLHILDQVFSLFSYHQFEVLHLLNTRSIGDFDTDQVCSSQYPLTDQTISTIVQIPRIQTILIMGGPWTIRQVLVPGGQCRLGDRSFLLAPDIQWILRFPMKEVCFHVALCSYTSHISSLQLCFALAHLHALQTVLSRVYIFASQKRRGRKKVNCFCHLFKRFSNSNIAS